MSSLGRGRSILNSWAMREKPRVNMTMSLMRHEAKMPGVNHNIWDNWWLNTEIMTYNGVSFNKGTMLYYDGVHWVKKPIYRWNGSSWVLVSQSY